jgi:hypothetical protein
MGWVNYVIRDLLGEPDLEFAWPTERPGQTSSTTR